VKLLWGTANLFSNPRYMCGAATNPDAHVFAYAAAQVKKALEVTKELGGENYVFWGGREGYETLLNTEPEAGAGAPGRVPAHGGRLREKIGFKGQFYIEPKPKEPTKHQYDFDVASGIAFLRTYGLEKHLQVQHRDEPRDARRAYVPARDRGGAAAQGMLGSIDANAGDMLLGWDTDQFNTDVKELTLAMVSILRAGGLGKGGFNFDAKLRRPSIDLEDLFYAHIGGMDAYALAFKLARRSSPTASWRSSSPTATRATTRATGRRSRREDRFPELEKLVLTKLGEPKSRGAAARNTSRTS
jgi:xylose isomerase